MRQSLRHFGQLLAISFGVGSIHLVTILKLDIDFPNNLLLRLYLTNILLAVLGYIAIRLAYLFKSQVEGFLFLMGSFLKFAILYLFFLTDETSPLHDSRQSFLHLFLPYIVCLIWEIAALAKILNQTPKTQS